jgi:chromosome segregation ATPase
MEKKDVKEMLDEHYAPLKAENEKLTGDLGKLQGEFDVQKTELGTATARVTELEGQIETKTAEFTAAGVELETAKGEATAATGFKAEYTALVLAKGIKSGAEVTEEEFATKTLEELKTLNTSYDTVIAAMVDGQQSGEDDDDATEATLDDSFYKS